MLPDPFRVPDHGIGRPTTIRGLAMSNRFKMWAYAAALFGGALLSSGCGFGLNKQWGTILAILQEDLFG